MMWSAWAMCGYHFTSRSSRAGAVPLGQLRITAWRIFVMLYARNAGSRPKPGPSTPGSARRLSMTATLATPRPLPPLGASGISQLLNSSGDASAQTMRTLLVVERPVARRDQVPPAFTDTYRLPPLSATASVEARVPMQPVSTMPSTHRGRPAPTGTSEPCPSIGRRYTAPSVAKWCADADTRILVFRNAANGGAVSPMKTFFDGPFRYSNYPD